MAIHHDTVAVAGFPVKPHLIAAFAASALCALLLPVAHAHADLDLDDTENYRYAQDYLVLLINQERSHAGLGSVRLDPLACQAAKQHADDMLASDYFSHWDMEGLKPTRRYNLLGGYHAVAENIYYVHGKAGTLNEMLEAQMATLMESEGHRATILGKDYTNVGLGFAADRMNFYAVQEFISRVGGEYYCVLTAQVGQRVELSGRFDSQRYSLAHVLVSFEERPEPRDRRWLMRTAEYQDGEKFVAGYTPGQNVIFPDLPTYHDIEVNQDAGWFRCGVLLDYKGREGMYYLSVWLRDDYTGKTVHAATATVDVTR
jgi:hypothetical protein